MSIFKINKILSSDKDCIKINEKLLKSIGIEEAVLYSYLVSQCCKNVRYKTNSQVFANEKYFFCPVEDIKETINLSAFRQRTALNNLQKKGLIKVKFGQARARYVHINEDAEMLKSIINEDSIGILKKEFVDFLLQQTINYKNERNINVDERTILTYAQNLSKGIVLELLETK